MTQETNEQATTQDSQTPESPTQEATTQTVEAPAPAKPPAKSKANSAALIEENERLKAEIEELRQQAEAGTTYQTQVEKLRKDLTDLRRDLRAKELESHRLSIVQALSPIAAEAGIPVPVVDYYLTSVKWDTLGTTEAQELFRSWVDGEGAAFKPKLVQPGPGVAGGLGTPTRPSGTISRSIKTSL